MKAVDAMKAWATLTICIYLTFAFVVADLNPSNWSFNQRLWLAIISILIFIRACYKTED